MFFVFFVQFLFLLVCEVFKLKADFLSLNDCLFGLLGGMLFFYPFWLVRIMGAGDVKFIAVLGFLLGWQSSVLIVLMSGLLAGPHALIQVLRVRIEDKYKNKKCLGVPYAGYIALSAIVWLIWKLLE